MIDKLSGNYAIAHGGYEYDGQLLSELDQQEITKLLEEWRGQVESIAIVGVFSSIKMIKNCRFVNGFKKSMARNSQFPAPH